MIKKFKKTMFVKLAGLSFGLACFSAMGQEAAVGFFNISGNGGCMQLKLQSSNQVAIDTVYKGEPEKYIPYSKFSEYINYPATIEVDISRYNLKDCNIPQGAIPALSCLYYLTINSNNPNDTSATSKFSNCLTPGDDNAITFENNPASYTLHSPSN